MASGGMHLTCQDGHTPACEGCTCVPHLGMQQGVIPAPFLTGAAPSPLPFLTGFLSSVFRGDTAHAVPCLLLHGTSPASWILFPAPQGISSSLLIKALTPRKIILLAVTALNYSKEWVLQVPLPYTILDLLFLSLFRSLPSLCSWLGSWTLRTLLLSNSAASAEQTWLRSQRGCGTSQAPELALLLRNSLVLHPSPSNVVRTLLRTCEYIPRGGG